MKTLRVVSVGLGPIGLAAAKLALEKHSINVVGAIDPDPAKVGRDLGELLGREASGITVRADVQAAYRELRPDAIIHCTSSFIPRVREQLEMAVDESINVVSSTEELLVPDHRYPEIARSLDQRAKAGNATIVGTGVNPGFAMDFLAVVASAACSGVDSVKCTRVLDAGTRRLPLQQKVGAGITIEEFRERQKAGGFGHIGMEESVVLVGRALGLELDKIEQSLEPVVATEGYQTPFSTIEAGRVAGIRNVGRGWRKGQMLVKLDLTMAVGAKNPRDQVDLTGLPPLTLLIPGGIPGDQATAAILVNTLRGVVEAEPGLKTVLDLPTPRVAR